MTAIQSFLVKKTDYSQTLIDSRLSEDMPELRSGEVLLKVDCFALTANNITYAAMGDALRYWEFFPAANGWGKIPVWGFADIVESNCEGLAVGERVYGYFPMDSHLRVSPQSITPASFMDGAPHRTDLSDIYNQYIRCDKDPLYTVESEAYQMLLRPLFTTSFLLDDFFADQEFLGANTIVLTSASSKTALGMAFLLHHNRSERDYNYEIVGLTSPGNLEFVNSLGCYDRVISYDDITSLDSEKPTVTVDFAGNGEVLGGLHAHLNENLKYSCLVGASHWDQRAGMPTDLKGPAPVMFFAPSQAAKRLKEWGGPGFQTRIASVWTLFLQSVEGWMTVETAQGADALDAVYQEVLSGHFDPKIGHIVSQGGTQ